MYDCPMSLFPGGSASSLKVCLVVEDGMDEEIMDDKEEQSEESRALRASLHVPAILLIEAESSQRRSKMTKR